MQELKSLGAVSRGAPTSSFETGPETPGLQVVQARLGLHEIQVRAVQAGAVGFILVWNTDRCRDAPGLEQRQGLGRFAGERSSVRLWKRQAWVLSVIDGWWTLP